MYNLLESRTVKEEEVKRLENLSPQKYGKAAYANLTFTPSKLSDNVLYKEVTTQKKYEEGTSKLRETQTMNSVFQDRLLQLQEERDGIEKTLNIQIQMYKKMLKQNEEKNTKRIQILTENFNLEITRILNQKQEQAKYSQSEKELLESRIFQLEEMLAQLKAEFNNLDSNANELKNEKEKLEIRVQTLQQRYEDLENKHQADGQKFREQIQELKRQLYNNQLEAKSKLQNAMHEKQRQIQSLERFHRTELEKVESKRTQEATVKNQQLKDLSATFEKQTNRLNEIISKKEELADTLNKTIDAEKDKNFAQAKGYQNQISDLIHEKGRLKEELLKSERAVENCMAQNEALQSELNNSNTTMQETIAKLKQDLELNQINYLRQADKNSFICGDLEKELVRLRLQNEQAAELAVQNTTLHRELRSMKELLMESSLEMERCKQQFIRLGREKDILIVKLRQMGLENDTLYRLKNDREDEARGWRESYIIQKGSSNY